MTKPCLSNGWVLFVAAASLPGVAATGIRIRCTILGPFFVYIAWQSWKLKTNWLCTCCGYTAKRRQHRQHPRAHRTRHRPPTRPSPPPPPPSLSHQRSYTFYRSFPWIPGIQMQSFPKGKKNFLPLKYPATKAKPRNIGSTVISRPNWPHLIMLTCVISHTCFTCTGRNNSPSAQCHCAKQSREHPKTNQNKAYCIRITHKRMCLNTHTIYENKNDIK